MVDPGFLKGGGGGGGIKYTFNNKMWEVVQNSASPFMFDAIFPFVEELPMKTIISSPKQGDILHIHIHFPMGPHPSLAQKGGGGACA